MNMQITSNQLSQLTTNFPPYTNQSIDLRSNAIEWFLYERMFVVNELTHFMSLVSLYTP